MYSPINQYEQAVFEDVCNIPLDSKVIGSEWVFDIKINGEGSVERYKARLVAKGFSQISGIYYFNTSSPVAQMNSVKVFYRKLQPITCIFTS